MDQGLVIRLQDQLIKWLVIILGAAMLDGKSLELLNSNYINSLIEYIYRRRKLNLEINDAMTRHILIQMWQKLLTEATNQLIVEFPVRTNFIQWQIFSEMDNQISIRFRVLSYSVIDSTDFTWHPPKVSEISPEPGSSTTVGFT